jgi:preprotein translocase subunit SecD
MFADLDDPRPPIADDGTRHRVDARTEAVIARARRNHRLTRTGLVVAVALFVVVVGAIAVIAGSGSSDHTEPVAPTGDVIATWSFVGQPSAADEQVTVDRLNQRLTATGEPATAWLQDDHVVVTVPPGQSARTDTLVLLARPGRLEFRPVIQAPDPSGHLAGTPVPGSGQILVPASEDPTRRGPDNQYILGPTVVDGSAVESVTTGLSQAGQWEVRPVFRAGPDGIDAFNAMVALCAPPSEACPSDSNSSAGNLTGSLTSAGGQIAVVFDDQVLEAPTIRAPRYERDQITISWAFDQALSTRFAAMITSGMLPAPLVLPGS